MKSSIVAAAVGLIQVTGPEGQRIDLNPAEVVSVREPRGDGHFAKDVRCLIHTADGKFIAVTEACDVVRQRLTEEDQ